MDTKKTCENCKQPKTLEDFKNEDSIICNQCKRENRQELMNIYKNTNLGIEALNKNLPEIKIFNRKVDYRWTISYTEAEELVRSGRANVISSDTIYQFKNNIKAVREQGICHYCGEHGETTDHIIPQSKGGKNNKENLVCSCFECNNLKADMSYEEFIAIIEKYGRKNFKRKMRNKTSSLIDKEKLNEQIFSEIEEKLNTSKKSIDNSFEDMMKNALKKSRW